MRKRYVLKAEQIRGLVENAGSCIASDKITVHGEKVGYMYREVPSNKIDSGWRFFSGAETQEFADNPENFDLYDVNTICNYDESIIALLDSPPRSAFERQHGSWVAIEFEGEDD